MGCIEELLSTTRAEAANPYAATVMVAYRQLDSRAAYQALRALSMELDVEELLLLSKAIKESELGERKEFISMVRHMELAAQFMNTPSGPVA